MAKLLRPMATPAGFITASESHFWDWVPASYQQLEQVEFKILESAVASPFEMTKIASLGTVIVPCSDEKKVKRGDVKNLVLVHGFAGGNAVWAANLAHLAKHFNVYAVEWTGVGRSDRPDFHHKDFDSANEFVLDAFETWRKELQLEDFHLCAHSMGAIFASSYAIQYPQNVDHLVLVSPAAVGRPVDPKDPTTGLALARKKSLFHRLLFFAWDNHVTPMSVVRFAGPYGPQLVLKALTRRYSSMPETSALRTRSIDINDLSEYIYHNWALKASGEKTFNTHMATGAQAIHPLIDMLQPETVSMPLTFIYGGGPDWMDFRHGQEIVDRFKKEDRKAALHLVPYAGHQVYLDNPEDFNRIVVKCLED